jgi:hypothetical protein
MQSRPSCQLRLLAFDGKKRQEQKNSGVQNPR